MTQFFVASTGAIRRQGGAQAAVQLAQDAIEQARKLSPAALLKGRDQQSVDAQWAAPVAGVDLSTMSKVYDPSAANGAGAAAALRTTGEQVTRAGRTYTRYWYLGACWQAQNGAACTAASAYAPFSRLIVAVTWPERLCSGGTCRFVSSMLISSKYADPLFSASGS